MIVRFAPILPLALDVGVVHGSIRVEYFDHSLRFVVSLQSADGDGVVSVAMRLQHWLRAGAST